MKIALLTTDVREHCKDYGNTQPSFGAAPQALLQGFEHSEELEVHVISCLQKPVRSPKKIAPNIWYHGLHVPKIGWLRTAYQGCLRAVRKCLSDVQPNIVHGQGTERDCAFCAVLSGFPNVVTIHGNMAELARLHHARIGSYGWISARLEDFTLRRTAGVFCNSRYTEQLVKGRSRHAWRIPNPLRREFFDTAPLAARSGTKPIILNIGVISPRKRQLEVLRIARSLHERGLPVEFRFVGVAPEGDPYARTFLNEMREAAQKGYALFLGFLELEELIRCFDEADGLVHFPMEEAFGLVVAEALARNLTFFGCRTGGIIDITEGVSGATLYEMNDWDGLRQGLEVWLRHGCPATSPGHLMRARYSPGIIAQRHLEIYREVLPARQGEARRRPCFGD
jgi:glycosyltransferase involved in cell wall biosynthesis